MRELTHVASIIEIVGINPDIFLFYHCKVFLAVTAEMVQDPLEHASTYNDLNSVSDQGPL